MKNKKTKKMFQVNRLEVYIQPVWVEAESADEAREKVEDGEGEVKEDMLEYSFTGDTEDWSVFDLKTGK